MRHPFRGQAGMVVTFMLGMVVAGAATAGAASLITGSQIKDGSVGAKDLTPAVRNQLKRIGPRGLQGPQGIQGTQGVKGDKGDAGPLTTTLPAGQTLRGAFNLDATGAAANASMGQSISFGFSLKTVPTVVIRPIGSAANAQCPGTLADPQAASGILCLYLNSTTNLSAGGLASLGFPSGASPQANTFGAELFIFSAAAGRFFADGTWAVTGN